MKRVVLHLPLLAVIVAAMVIGILAGLARLGIEMPTLAMERIVLHGPILVAGVLGTLIALERAVAMRTVMGQRWTWADAAPILSGAGTILLLVNGATVPAVGLLTLGAAGLLLVNLAMLRRHPTLDVLTMTLGAGFLLLADAAWLTERPVALLTPWWIAFLVLTIAGERLELAKMRAHGPRAQRTFVVTVAIYIAALLFMVVDASLGVRLSGIGMLALTAWLFRFDIAIVTIRRPGLPRFVAACLLAGYVWLAIAGLIAIGAEQIWSGLAYDAFLHAALLGFVFSMIFGHAPIIVPAILEGPVSFHPIAWFPLVLLHVSVASRIVADLITDQGLRQTAGILSAIAIALYGGVIVLSVLQGRTRSKAPRSGSVAT